MVSPTRLLAGRLAHDAPVDALAAGSQQFHHALGAVHRRAFLVAGDQEGDGALVVGALAHEGFGGRHHGGKAALHVGRATAVEPAVDDGGLEGIGAPFLQRPGGHDVGVAGEAQHRAAAAVRGPEILDAAEVQLLDAEPAAARRCDHQLLAAAVRGSHGGAGDQVQGQFEGVRILQCRSSVRMRGGRSGCAAPSRFKHLSARGKQFPALQ